MTAQRPPASDLSRQWREQGEYLIRTHSVCEECDTLEGGRALIAATDTCDRLEHAKKNVAESLERLFTENTKLRELLAESQMRCPCGDGTCDHCAAIDEALKVKS